MGVDMRCFIGIRLPDNVIERIDNIKGRIDSPDIECKFVESENLHICMAFLGEVVEERVNKISDKLEDICNNHEKMNLKITGIKLIPNDSYVRVIALDVKDTTNNIQSIMDEIHKNIGGKSHDPHITLCRVSGIKNKKKTMSDIKNTDVDIKDFTINEIEIIESELTRRGPVYTVLKKFRL